MLLVFIVFITFCVHLLEIIICVYTAFLVIGQTALNFEKYAYLIVVRCYMSITGKGTLKKDITDFYIY